VLDFHQLPGAVAQGGRYPRTSKPVNRTDRGICHRRRPAYNPGVPEPRPAVPRSRDDRCPGALRLAEAADGFLARVRLPGGLVSAAQLLALARLASELGDGRVELTSRGNVQLRGLAAGAAEPLTWELTEAGLLPSVDHDRVRNVLASPLAGLDRGADLTGLVRALDAGLCGRPRLAGLPGRFLFAVDDGRGDVAGLSADVTATLTPTGAVVNGLAVPAACLPNAFAGPRPGKLPAGLRDATKDVMLAFAEAFLDLRAEHGGSAWRVAELPGGAEQLRDRVLARLGLATAEADAAGRAASGVRPVGLIRPDEAPDRGARAPDLASLVLLAPLGRLTATQLTWVADQLAGAAARVTPWRSMVLPRLPDAAAAIGEAAGLGFGTDGSSPWLRVTACAGRPGCASALADVQADAVGLAERWPGRLVHVSGCARHCGRPAATEIDVTATSEGYQVAGI
jgi:precorrin-3B synthase